MNEDDTKDALRDLGARVFALQAGLMAVMRTHPNPQELSAALDLIQEPPKAVMLGLTWSDSTLEKFDQTLKQLRDQIHQK
jgi:DNA-binding MurR/RpiR family transcriptional regulator